MSFVAFDDQSKGGADVSLVRVGDLGKPSCVVHGAMNKVSEHGLWRCIATSGPKVNGCRAACVEVE